jgi:hypothetical protein
VAQELAAQVIGVKSFALPGAPLGVEREAIGQLPSGPGVATGDFLRVLSSRRMRWDLRRCRRFGPVARYGANPPQRCAA